MMQLRKMLPYAAALAGGVAALMLSACGGKDVTQDEVKALNTPTPAASAYRAATPTFQHRASRDRPAVSYKRLEQQAIVDKYLKSLYPHVDEKLLGEIERDEATLMGLEGEFTEDGREDAFVVFINSPTCKPCRGILYWGLENTGSGYRVIRPPGTLFWSPATTVSTVYPADFDGGTKEIILEVVNNHPTRGVSKAVVIFPFNDREKTQIKFDLPSTSKSFAADIDGDGNPEFGIVQYPTGDISAYERTGELLEPVKIIAPEISNVVKDMLQKLSNPLYSENEKVTEMESILSRDPEAASVAVKVIIGDGIGRYLNQQDQDLALTQYFSALARDNFSAAAADLGSLNVAGSIAHVLAAVWTERVAAGVIQGLSSDVDRSSQTSGHCPGAYGVSGYSIPDPKAPGQIIGPFNTCAEAQQALEERRK